MSLKAGTMKKCTVLFLVYNLMFIHLHSQENMSLPFTVKGNLMIIQAEVDGKRGNFVIDTGVKYLVLNKAYHQGLQAEKAFHHVFGPRHDVENNFAQLRIGESFSKKMYADIIDLQQIEASLGCTIQGLIGTHVLRYFKMVIFNFKNLEITLVQEPEALGLSTSPPKDIIHFTWKGHMPSVTANIAGRALPFALDTGAGMNLISMGKKKMLQRFRSSSQGRVSIRSFGSESKKMDLAKLKGLQVGNRPCPPLIFAFASLSWINKELEGVPVYGLFGYSAFGAMKMAIHFRKKQIYLWGDYPRPKDPELAKATSIPAPRTVRSASILPDQEW